MELTVSQECPQCGGTCDLGEASRLLVCPYCGVRLLLGQDLPHYLLPCKMAGEELIWVPYLRLKGAVYTCTLTGVDHHLVDTSLAGVKINILPPSLGFRPQTMKLRFPSPEQPGLFLDNTLTIQDALHQTSVHQREIMDKKTIIHEEWIGETASIIYLPLIRDQGVIYDGITRAPLAHAPDDEHFFSRHSHGKIPFTLTLLSNLCPNCGWDLECHDQSIILFCHNCDRAWQLEDDGLCPVSTTSIPGKQANSIHLPFWAMEISADGVELNSFADFLRLTNIPMAIKPQWAEKKMTFFCPAFRLNSKAFLRIASQMTLAQLTTTAKDTIPSHIYPANLAASEAIESIKLILATSAVAKRNILPLLAEITITSGQPQLTLLPFFDNGRELCQEEKMVSINKQALALGQKM